MRRLVTSVAAIKLAGAVAADGLRRRQDAALLSGLELARAKLPDSDADRGLSARHCLGGSTRTNRWDVTLGERARAWPAALTWRRLSLVTAAEKILGDALSLPEEERRRIAEVLLDSVSIDSAAEIEAVWVAEAVRRADELERGEAEALDGRSVLEALKAKFQSAGR